MMMLVLCFSTVVISRRQPLMGVCIVVYSLSFLLIFATFLYPPLMPSRLVTRILFVLVLGSM